MRRSNLIRLFVLAILFYGVVRIRRQFVFQQFLSHSKVKFDDFPSKYVEALDAAVSSGHEPLDFDYASTFTRNQIPRIIHFISFKNIYQSSEGTDDIPLLGSRAPQLCQQYNPDYDIRIWNATNALEFLTAEYEWFLPIYNNYRYPIQRIDALKYFLLWHYGGVYMDLDIACRRPLDPLLDFPIWFPEASPLGVNNDLMASIPKHPIFGKMTTALATHNRNFIFPYLTIFCSTGPQFTSDIVQEHFESLSANGPSKELPGKPLLPIYYVSASD